VYHPYTTCRTLSWEQQWQTAHVETYSTAMWTRNDT